MQVNPFARVERTKDDCIRLQCPMRGIGLQTSVIRPAEEPEVFRILERVKSNGAEEGLELELSEAAWRRLVEIGFIVDSCTLPHQIRFRCPLFVEKIFTAARTPMPMINPYLSRSSAPEPFAGPEILWVRDPITQFENPFHVDVDWINRLTSTSLHLLSLQQWAKHYPGLWDAGVLFDHTVTATRLAWNRSIENAAHKFRERGCCVVRSLLRRSQLKALSYYFEQLVQEGFTKRGDAHVAERWVLHNEGMGLFLQRQFHSLIEQIVGSELQPSYSYFSSYLPGAELSMHRDREQGEIAVSLLVSQQRPPNHAGGWPLHVEQKGELAVITIAPGDIIVFRGTELRHGRPRLPNGWRSTSVLLFYVGSGFDGPLD